MSNFHLKHVDSDQDYEACFQIMRELRPHLTDAETFAIQVRRQSVQGYRLLAAWQNNEVKGLAGYRFLENLIYGRFLYVDDLVIASDARSQGLGAELIDTVRDEAKWTSCAHLVLDTGLANALGQRFYFRQGMLPKGLHFCQQLSTT
jgi:GNAT superfamily N-acetyltransferase